MLRSLFTIAFVLTAFRLHGGVVYRFTSSDTTNSLGHKGSGRVFLEGDRSRSELDPADSPRMADVAIVRDGKTLMINHQNSTWYEQEDHPGGSGSLLFSLPFPGSKLKGNPASRRAMSRPVKPWPAGRRSRR